MNPATGSDKPVRHICGFTAQKAVALEGKSSPFWSGSLLPHLVWVELMQGKAGVILISVAFSPKPFIIVITANQTLVHQPTAPWRLEDLGWAFGCTQTSLPPLQPTALSHCAHLSLSRHLCCSGCLLLFPILTPCQFTGRAPLRQHRQTAPNSLLCQLFHYTFAINLFCLGFLSPWLSFPLIFSGTVWKWFWCFSSCSFLFALLGFVLWGKYHNCLWGRDPLIDNVKKK